jgi:hypothetical protein
MTAAFFPSGAPGASAHARCPMTNPFIRKLEYGADLTDDSQKKLRANIVEPNDLPSASDKC